MPDQVIAVVDDESVVRDLVKEVLSADGYRVEGFRDAKTLFGYLDRNIPRVIILDRVLPDIQGFEICRKLRQSDRTSMVPVIMLSRKGDVSDKVEGLNVGADDYLAKPFEPAELRARVRALLRRRGSGGGGEHIRIDEKLDIDLGKCRVLCREREIELTFAEFKVLELLASREGQVFERESILKHLWGDEKIVVERTVGFHVRNLRKKLGPDGGLIKNVRGFGYKLEDNRGDPPG